jgi:Domain of unknown function (DUF4062)
MQNSRTFRVFISSTFSDMKEERNALHEYVFPRLQDLCERHGCQFQAIDLRWGISEEAGLDQQTMKICLEEIARCQAISRSLNFIILMGDRYGWRPLPSTIDAIEFEEILGMVPSNKRPLLMGDERGAGGCKGWYRKDFNAVPPEYCLWSRSIELSENEDEPNILLSKELDYVQWKQVECELRRIFLEAIDKLVS